MGRDAQYAAINRQARINSPGRVAGRPSAAGFYSTRKTMRGKKTMRGRRDDEDDDRLLSPTSRGHQTRGNFPRCFPRIRSVRSPRARSGELGMT
jgi:hypothetical protein